VVDTQKLSAEIVEQEKAKKVALAEVKEAKNEVMISEDFDIIVDVETPYENRGVVEEDAQETHEVASGQPQQPKKPRPRKSPRTPTHMEYSAAVDVSSQGFITKA
jgi:hypothetical protein